MNADSTIRLAGRPCTIVRTGGNVSTYCVGFNVDSTMVARRRIDPVFDYEYGYAFATSSGITGGDLVLIDSEYYLAAAVGAQYIFGTLVEYRCTLWKCNGSINIYTFNETTKRHNTLVKSSVPCLFRPSMDRPWYTDRASIIKSGARVDPSELIVQRVSGLTSACIATDVVNNRNFRIGDFIDYFLADGLLVAQVVWER